MIANAKPVAANITPDQKSFGFFNFTVPLRFDRADKLQEVKFAARKRRDRFPQRHDLRRARVQRAGATSCAPESRPADSRRGARRGRARHEQVRDRRIDRGIQQSRVLLGLVIPNGFSRFFLLPPRRFSNPWRKRRMR